MLGTIIILLIILNVILLSLGVFLMATFQDLAAAQAATAQAIADLAARAGNISAQLDTAVAQEQSQAAAVAAILP